ncbi:HAL/PAL/TAL family ammonia-lyase [Argonema antarcticum]|uniref:HAL/PAL/TAL family ammonia-lyase n=1 Tax=Argonema antarcticum TaxID=2942763 RepID=UPI0020136C16|nr:aromatic amino acid ammonia-lyase [Argonema antarcticum]MCL1475208.1 aromatic amino acid ammonia-lyase [Argonema antarcticum A004/B2]
MIENLTAPTAQILASLQSSKAKKNTDAIIGDRLLTIEQVVKVAREEAQVKLTDNSHILKRIKAACDYIGQAVDSGKPIYGVTTKFGGMANKAIAPDDAAELQNNLVWYHKAGAGKRLPIADVRAAMLLRMNSHLQGASGIRLKLIDRMKTFLNSNVTPHVPELGSIGASGDLTPLAYITGSIIGLDKRFTVDFNGVEMSSLEALERLGMPPIDLLPKEGLAMMNGTSVMTGIAALCTYDAQVLLALAMGSHALMIQGLGGTNQSFHPFIHRLKPHFGQVWTAAEMVKLLAESRLSFDELNGANHFNGESLIQDRYSLRCLPQYMGPIVDGIREIESQIEVEINSVTDNPVIDVNHQTSYHGGNFLGQYISVGMDRLRHLLGLLAKHLDVQIALLAAPEFNNGLSASLVGNTDGKVNMGLKALQITGNSIMPMLTFYGNSIADRFPTHAEQFNQNINSQGFAAANLTRNSIELAQQYMAVALMFGVQAVDLRTFKVAGHYDGRKCLSSRTKPLYEAVRQVVGKAPSAKEPYIWNDRDQFLDEHLAAIAADIQAGGVIVQAVKEILERLGDKS